MSNPSSHSPAGNFDPLTVPIQPGRSLIEASAGTGKTFAITGLVLRLVLEGKSTDLRKLLVVTFTVAATNELRTRIRKALRHALIQFTGQTNVDPKLQPMLVRFEEEYCATEESRSLSVRRLRKVLLQVDEASIFTIHGFCKQALEQAAFESGMPFAFNFTEEAEDILSRVATDFWHRHTYNDNMLSELLIAREWNNSKLLQHYKKYARYPNTEMVPPAMSLTEAFKALSQATTSLKQIWDVEEMVSLLQSVRWNSKAPFLGGALREVVERVQIFTQNKSLAHLSAVAHCIPENINKHAYKRGNAAKEQLKEVLAHPAFAACQEVLTKAKQIDYSVIQAFVREVSEQFDATKRAQDVLTYDDLLQRLYAALVSTQTGPALARSMQEQYSIVLVDEFQDTDPVQYGIFEHAFPSSPVFFIGDPKQSIYGFRGADIFAYLNAQSNAKTQYSLGTNWRSTSHLVTATNAFFSSHSRPFVYDRIPFVSVKPSGNVDEKQLQGDKHKALVWMYVSSQSSSKPQTKSKARPQIEQATVQEICRLTRTHVHLGEDKVEPSNIAVLVRTNKQAMSMQEALRKAGVPSVVSRSGDIMISQEMQDIEYILQAIAKPHKSSMLRAALATELWGYSAQQIQELSEDDRQWTEKLEQIQSLHKLWRERGFLKMIYHFLGEEGLTPKILQFADGERRMTNLRHCIEILHKAEQKQHRSIEDLLRWLREREIRRLTEGEESQLRLESDELAVQISTIHNSKGLEYDIVFCTSLWDSRNSQESPLVHVGDNVVYDLGSDNIEYHQELAQAESLAEDLRLAYVALTRAKYRCYVAWGPLSGADSSALGYLFHGELQNSSLSPQEYVKVAKAQVKKQFLQTRHALDKLIAENRESMSLLECKEENLQQGDASFLQAQGEEVTLQPRTLRHDTIEQLRLAWWLSSFSKLTSSVHESLGEKPPPWVLEDPSEAEGMFAFASGPDVGNCLHEIIERVDFTQIESDRTSVVIERTLFKYDLADPDRHRTPIDPQEVVENLVQQLVTTPLPNTSITLSQISRKHRLDEWRFAIPLQGLNASKLAALFREHGSESIKAEYASQVAQLDDKEVRGFLVGIVDLIFEHQGKWYILDWKSNYLGNSFASYSAEAVQEAMLQHHYILQYHLYCVGLHKYLKTRLPNYDYDRHFGGVGYVFLRGVNPEQSTGWFWDRPSKEMIQQISHQSGAVEYV